MGARSAYQLPQARRHVPIVTRVRGQRRLGYWHPTGVEPGDQAGEGRGMPVFGHRPQLSPKVHSLLLNQDFASNAP